MLHFLQLNSNTLNIIASLPCSRHTETRFTIYKDKFYETPFLVIYRERRFLFLPVKEIKITENLTNYLEAIYEQNFVEVSYGFRPKRGCHEALEVVDNTIITKPVNADTSFYCNRILFQQLVHLQKL